MTEAIGVDCLKVRTKGSTPVVGERAVRLVRGGCLGDSVDVGPLFDSFEEVLRVEGGVSAGAR